MSLGVGIHIFCDLGYLSDLMVLGYYPPDHSIVTGGPDTLDSFEALLYGDLQSACMPFIKDVYPAENWLNSLVKSSLPL